MLESARLDPAEGQDFDVKRVESYVVTVVKDSEVVDPPSPARGAFHTVFRCVIMHLHR